MSTSRVSLLFRALAWHAVQFNMRSRHPPEALGRRPGGRVLPCALEGDIKQMAVLAMGFVVDRQHVAALGVLLVTALAAQALGQPVRPQDALFSEMEFVVEGDRAL